MCSSIAFTARNYSKRTFNAVMRQILCYFAQFFIELNYSTVQDCVEVALEYMELPNIENGGLYVLLLSSVKWSDLALTLLRDVEKVNFII